MKKKLLAILLSMVMVAGLLPTVAFAAENYDLYVNGEQFTSEKLSIACGEGTASYDPNTKTLMLNNATITNGGKSDESPKYGIRVVGDTDLTIKLSGTNSITLDNGGGIFADGSSDNYNIIGDGKLTINVKWDALYTLNGNISISEGAKLDITSAQGCGITSYNKGILSIDGAKVAVSSYYTAASAKELEIKNNSEVVLIASADQFNAVYMGDENGAGKIEITNSKVEATSYYPALFTEGNLTVNGGEVKCTSTADGAIWTKGDILIKGGAKVTTDSKFPMGGNGTFTVEEAEIDAKNTNENNIPAIFDESVPVIADGYKLTYAKAVDSEETEIDLLSSGTQYFALYKNVHFITKAVYPVSFVVTPEGLTNVVIKVNGQEINGSVSLTAGTHSVEVTADNCEVYSDNITITADTATHTQTIAMTYLPADYSKVDAAIAKANALNKDDYKDFSGVEAAVNAVIRDKNITEQTEVDAMAKAIEDAITALQYKDADYTKVDEAIAKANALNKDEYKDFVFRFEFKLTPGANNGLGIRTPTEGDAAYVGMELQILDNDAPIYKNLEPYQYHGSVYGVIPAKRGALKPVGEWNYQEVIAKGNHIKVILNGEVIVDGDIAKASDNGKATADHKQHPGLLNEKGHIGFLGHGSEVHFRNIRIKEL